jgi:acyl-coenzyme A thioesterase PaaI-like protein
MPDTAKRREEASPFGEWDGAVDVLMSYRYLASAPRLIDRTHAEGTVPLRPDLRTPGGAVFGAPLAIGMLDVAGITVDRFWILALTQVNVNMLAGAVDTKTVHFEGRVTSEARSQIFTEARIYDADDRDTVIGFGSANWSVICPTPEGFSYPEPGTGTEGMAEVPPLWQAYGGRRRDDERLEIPGLRPEIGTQRLHHGPMLVVSEAAALEAAALALGTDQIVVEHLSTTIVAPGRIGPFVATPVFVAVHGDAVACRVELRDSGRDDRVVAATFVRMRRHDAG